MRYIFIHKKFVLIFIFFISINVLVFLRGCKNTLIENTEEPLNQYTLVPADFADYRSIINMYQKIVEISFDYDNEREISDIYYAMFEIPGEVECNWFKEVINSVIGFMVYVYDIENRKEAFGYALRDLNGNGKDELVLTFHNYFDGYTVLAIFSMTDGKPILLDSFQPRYRCTIDSDGTLFVRGSSGAAYLDNYIYIISQDGSELVLIDGFGTYGWDAEKEETIYYKIINGEMIRVSREEITTLWDTFQDDIDEETTKYSGLMFVPLFD